MRIICAWCKRLIGYKCALCGAPLRQDPHNKSLLICESGPTTIHFGTENMTETHGICPECLAEAARLTPEDRANAQAERQGS